MSETVKCDCKEWEVGMPQISGAQMFFSTRAGYEPYTGGTFKYCPWCGNETVPEED